MVLPVGMTSNEGMTVAVEVYSSKAENKDRTSGRTTPQDVFVQIAPLAGIMWIDSNGDIRVGSMANPEVRQRVIRDIRTNAGKELRAAGQPIFNDPVVDLDQARALRGLPQPEIVKQHKIGVERADQPSRTVEPVSSAKTDAPAPKSNGCGGGTATGATSGPITTTLLGAVLLSGFLLFLKLNPELMALALALDFVKEQQKSLRGI